jgi:tRNA1(Val) A37 N6-methylase TrmN6
MLLRRATEVELTAIGVANHELSTDDNAWCATARHVLAEFGDLAFVEHAARIVL